MCGTLTLFFACQQGHAFSPQGHFRQVDRSSGILLRCRFQGYPPLQSPVQGRGKLVKKGSEVEPGLRPTSQVEVKRMFDTRLPVIDPESSHHFLSTCRQLKLLEEEKCG